MKSLQRNRSPKKFNVDKSNNVQIYGENKIHCKGFCISGPTFLTVISSFFMILVPIIVFHVFSSRWFIKNEIYYVTASNLLFFLLTIFAFFKTSFMDPGIIPRNVC